MKKITILGVAICSFFIFFGCSSKTTKETKYYDEQYIKSLATGLDNRWKYSDSEAAKKDAAIDSLTKSTNLEVNTLKKGKFSEKKFKDSKLKELSLSYDNELKNGLQILDSATESNISDYNGKWETHYNNRTKLLSEINGIKKIPVKNEKILKELLNNGSDVKKNNELEAKINDNLSKIVFAEKPQEYESDYKEYEAVVTNETGTNFKTFSANVYLEDQAGTRIDSQYISADDWAAGQKVTFTFMTNKAFTTSKVVKNYFEVAK